LGEVGAVSLTKIEGGLRVLGETKAIRDSGELEFVLESLLTELGFEIDLVLSVDSNFWYSHRHRVGKDLIVGFTRGEKGCQVRVGCKDVEKEVHLRVFSETDTSFYIPELLKLIRETWEDGR
jgi:hypothetical protein